MTQLIVEHTDHVYLFILLCDNILMIDQKLLITVTINYKVKLSYMIIPLQFKLNKCL